MEQLTAYVAEGGSCGTDGGSISGLFRAVVDHLVGCIIT